MFDEDDVAMINKIECLANLKDTILKLKARGVTIVAATEGEKIVKIPNPFATQLKKFQIIF